MKNEAEFNTIVTHSLTFGHKIGDQGSTITGFHGKNPFDGFGIASTDLGNYPVYFESKFLKEPSAFNWSRLEDHQIENLLLCKKLLPDCLALFLVCVDFGRANKKVFVFRDMEYISNRKLSKKSITKKEFIARQNFILIKKNKIDFDEIIKMPLELEYYEV